MNLTVTNANGSSGFQRAGYINVTGAPGDDNLSYVADHLYSYYNWTGDSGSTVADSSGYGHNGENSGSILNNGPIATRTFDGTAKIDVPQQPVIGWDGFTYETIILPTNVTTRTTHGIVGQGYGYNTLYLDGAKLVIRIVNVGGYATEARSGNISTDRPTHIVMTYNNTTKYARLYINGLYVTQVQLSSAGSRGQVWKVFNEFLPSIGDRYIYVLGMGKFEGTMGYLRVYDTGLTDVQVQQNYQAEQWRLAPAQRPVANFTSNMTTGTAPLTVQFWDNSTGSPTAWQWQWGDGTLNGTTRNPVHTYTTAGIYTINLTTSNAYGSSAIQHIAYINATEPTGYGLILNNSFIKGAYSLINTHAHTNMSDGEYDPRTLIQQYKNLGFSAAAITDHWGITSDPFVPGITFLQGTEWSTEPGHPPVPYQHGDVIILSANFYNGMVRAYNTSSNYYHYWSDVREFKDKYNGILIYCHPDSSNSWNYSTIASAARDFDIVEVQNDGVTQNMTAKVDPWLNQGNRMWLVSGSDAHHNASLYNWDVVNANDNSNMSIIEAMRAGNFIAYYGWEYMGQPFVEDILVSGMNITIRLKAESTITWIGAGGKTLKTETARNGTYTAFGTENYVRAYVSYNGGALQAWTQPIYIEPAGPIVKFNTSTYIPSYFVRNANGKLSVQIKKMGTGACYVNYTTVNGTALAGVNYAAMSGRLVFNATETSKTIDVPIIYSSAGSGAIFYLNITSASASYGNVRNATVVIQ